MNCDHFERAWNERLDTRPGAAFDPGGELAEHAAQCAACRAIQQRYQVLSQALQVWGGPPSPPADLTARVLTAWEAERRRPRLGPAVRWAALAAAVMLAVVASTRFRSRPAPDRPGRTAQPLNVALAVATDATWDLARDSSAPAARIGRRVLATTPRFEGSAWPVGVDAGPKAGAWRNVGLNLGDGVRPLSESTRHAFGFLLPGPPRRPQEEPDDAPRLPEHRS